MKIIDVTVPLYLISIGLVFKASGIVDWVWLLNLIGVVISITIILNISNRSKMG